MWVAVPKMDGKFKFKNTLNKVCEWSLSKNTLHLRIKTYPRNIFKEPNV